MKNFVLLFSSLAVASSAFAVAPKSIKGSENIPVAKLEPVVVTMSQDKIGKVLPKQNLERTSKVVAKVPKKAGSLTVSYEEPSGLFALGFSEDGKFGLVGTSYRKGPAYTPLTWTNTSVGASEFEWEVMEDFQTGTPTIYKTQDLVHSETWSMTDAPILYGLDAAGNADVFQFGAEKISDTELDKPTVGYYYGGDTSPYEGVPELGISTYKYGQNATDDFIGVGCMAYAKGEKDFDPVTGLDPIFTDKEGFGFVDPKFIGYGNFFPAPAAPYYISKMWTWMAATPNKVTVVELTLYRVSEDGSITDEIVAQGSCTLDPKNASQWWIFDLYALDEDGLQTDEPIVIDCGVLAEMTFTIDDIDQVFPITGNGAVFDKDAQSIPYPIHAFMIVEDIDEEGEVQTYLPRTPYVYGAPDPNQYVAITDWLWMMDAVFPWTYCVDGKNEAQAPVEGGTVSFNFSSYDNPGDYLYYLTDYVSGEPCEWIDFENASLDINEDLQCYVLNLPVDALPSDVAGRSAIVELECIATSLKLYVHQGESTGVNVIAVDNDVEYFDLAGRRVANPDKGIYIKKTGNKAEKVLF